tara:strand:- start:32 stop:244 length:213 start_codon:yes stop_codon:yes gene_type:complete
MRWSFGMRYIIATLKDGDDDGWAEAQLIKLAEDGVLDPIEVPRHGDSLDVERAKRVAVNSLPRLEKGVTR